MKPMIPLLLPILIIVSMSTSAADMPGNRLCTMQGREIALRVGEELDTALNADERNQIARIAARVCVDFAEEGNMPVVARPNSDLAARASSEASAMARSEEVVSDVENDENDENEEERKGLFGNLKIIDPEDRVKRPGLKRK